MGSVSQNHAAAAATSSLAIHSETACKSSELSRVRRAAHSESRRERVEFRVPDWPAARVVFAASCAACAARRAKSAWSDLESPPKVAMSDPRKRDCSQTKGPGFKLRSGHARPSNSATKREAEANCISRRLTTGSPAVKRAARGRDRGGRRRAQKLSRSPARPARALVVRSLDALRPQKTAARAEDCCCCAKRRPGPPSSDRPIRAPSCEPNARQWANGWLRAWQKPPKAAPLRRSDPRYKKIRRSPARPTAHFRLARQSLACIARPPPHGRL